MKWLKTTILVETAVIIMLVVFIVSYSWAHSLVVNIESVEINVTFKNEFRNITVNVNQTIVFNSSMYTVYESGAIYLRITESLSSPMNTTLIWDFDASDGICGDTVGWNVTHNFTALGVYSVTLTVVTNSWLRPHDELYAAADSITVTVI